MSAEAARPPPGTRLCALDDLRAATAPRALGLEFTRGDARFSMFLVCGRDGVPRAYVNHCPHAGTPLEITPHGFLTRDGSMIMCRTHGALFRIEDGLCIAGPCPGRSLQSLPVTVSGEDVLLAPPPHSTLPEE